MQNIISGNEAIALSFGDSGGVFASGYPGTPSTETLEEVARLGRVYCEWAPNEKVALEAPSAAPWPAALAGCHEACGCERCRGSAYDPGLHRRNAGLVLMVADDPGMSVPRTSRIAATTPGSQRSRCSTRPTPRKPTTLFGTAFEISEPFDTPVILRTTTRISHCQGRCRDRRSDP